MNAAIPLCAAVLAVSLPGRADTVAVLELESRVPDAELKTAPLAEQVRSVAARTLGEARVLDAETCSRRCNPRAAGADLVVSGELARGGDGYLVTLELRAARSDRLVGAASATGANADELADAVAGAAVNLFRAQKAVSAVSISPAVLPEVPRPAPLLPGGARNLEVDASVLVAYDDARRRSRPARRGPTRRPPRGGPWPSWGVKTPIATWRLRAPVSGRTTPRASAPSTRSSLATPEGCARCCRSPSSPKAPSSSSSPAMRTPTAGQRRSRSSSCSPANCAAGPSSPSAARTRTPASRMSLARAADRAHDAQGALDALDRACSADSADACAEAGDRWLRPETRDVARAASGAGARLQRRQRPGVRAAGAGLRGG